MNGCASIAARGAPGAADFVRVGESGDAIDADAYARAFGALRGVTEAVTGPARWRLLQIPLRDASSDIVGGLWGVTGYDWLHITLLFVPEGLRGRAIGARLVLQAETEGLARGCHTARVEAFDFQATGFYERLGYAASDHLDDHPRGFRQTYLRKRLSETRGV